MEERQKQRQQRTKPRSVGERLEDFKFYCAQNSQRDALLAGFTGISLSYQPDYAQKIYERFFPQGNGERNHYWFDTSALIQEHKNFIRGERNGEILFIRLPSFYAACCHGLCSISGGDEFAVLRDKINSIRHLHNDMVFGALNMENVTVPDEILDEFASMPDKISLVRSRSYKRFLIKQREIRDEVVSAIKMQQKRDSVLHRMRDVRNSRQFADGLDYYAQRALEKGIKISEKDNALITYAIINAIRTLRTQVIFTRDQGILNLACETEDEMRRILKSKGLFRVHEISDDKTGFGRLEITLYND